MFVHLRGRSTYSMLEGIGSLSELLRKIQSFGQKSVAITDLYGVYGAVDFYSKSKNFDIKPIIGVEIPYTSHLASFTPTKGQSFFSTLTFLAYSDVGYHNLLRLVSAGYTNTVNEIPLVDLSVLQQYHEGLLVLVGGLGSYITEALTLYNDQKKAQEHIEQLLDIFSKYDVVFDVTAQLYTDYPLLESVNNFLIDYAQKYDIMVLTTSGYLYPETTQKLPYQTALAIKDGKRIYDMDARKIVGNHHILSEQEVRIILQKNGFSDEIINRLVDATVQVADRCQAKITLGQALFPNYDTPHDIQLLYDQYKDQLIIHE